MDIGSGNSYPANALSNFAPHRFNVDGVECNSMEGFLQSLKYKNPEMQIEVCKLVGRKAKFAGKKKKWWRTQTLYWQGKEYSRDSKEYQRLLHHAYNCLYRDSDSFRKALKASGESFFTHTIGKNDETKTVLTRLEFCTRLTCLREFGFLPGEENNK